MARKPLRPAAHDNPDLNTRDRLLLAGKEEFLLNGLRAAKIASICRRAQLANGTFYLHFRTTEDLYRALIAVAAGELARRLAVASSAELDARERDRAEVTVIFTFAEEREDLFKLMWDERASYSVAHAAFLELLKEQRSAAIAKGIETGAFRADLDPLLTAIAEIGLTTELLQWWILNRDAHPKQFVIDKLIDMRSWVLFPN